MAIFFTADAHFGHANIIKHCNRPFASVEEMDETLIANWNAKVGRQDSVYILGDLIFKAAKEPEEYLKRLNGNKYLIKGNHDNSWVSKVDLEKFFAAVWQMGYTKDSGVEMVMCHYPMTDWPKKHHGTYMIHGHIHNNTDLDSWSFLKNNDHILNAGVDVCGFCPVTFRELVAMNYTFKNNE